MTEDAFADEIVEIFVEESHDVLAQIDENFPLWKHQPDNEKALKEVRRAFHTLKGSGRMVQAEDLGELAWAVENMLNRVIDGTLAPSPSILELVKVVRGVVPAMVNAFQNKQAAALVGVNFNQLIDQANALVAGKPVDSLSHFKSADEKIVAGKEAEDEVLQMNPDLDNVEVNALQEQVSVLHHQVDEMKRNVLAMSSRMDTIAAQVKLMPKAVDADGVNKQLDVMNKEVQELKYFFKASSEQMMKDVNAVTQKSVQRLDKELKRAQEISGGMRDDIEISTHLMKSELLSQIKLWAIGSALACSVIAVGVAIILG